MTVERVGEGDLDDLLPLLRAYCDFYEVSPSDEDLRALALALIADPAHEGVQLIARDDDGSPLGFATLFWTWQTLDGGRAGVMNDLFVVPGARRRGIGAALIGACRELCRERGARILAWDTAPDNRAAQALYRRTGAEEEPSIAFSLEV